MWSGYGDALFGGTFPSAPMPGGGPVPPMYCFEPGQAGAGPAAAWQPRGAAPLGLPSAAMASPAAAAPAAGMRGECAAWGGAGMGVQAAAWSGAIAHRLQHAEHSSPPLHAAGITPPAPPNLVAHPSASAAAHLARAGGLPSGLAAFPTPHALLSEAVQAQGSALHMRQAGLP